MVYKGTPSSLNSYLWAPHLELPTVGSTLCAAERGTFTADQDIEEMFLNFMLIEDVRPLCEVDITNGRTE